MKSNARPPGSSSRPGAARAKARPAAAAEVVRAARASQARRGCGPNMASSPVWMVLDSRISPILEDRPPDLRDLADRQPPPQQVAALAQVLGGRSGGRLHPLPLGRGMDVPLAHQGAVPVVGAPLEDL